MSDKQPLTLSYVYPAADSLYQLGARCFATDKVKTKYVLAGIAVVLMLTFEYYTAAADYQRYDDEYDYGVARL